MASDKPWKDVIIPQTVPNNPTYGLTEPTLAKKDKCLFISSSSEAIETLIDLLILSRSNSEILSSELITENSSNRIITSNNIPNHDVGIFGNVSGAINPNSISPQNGNYSISLNPIKNSESITLEDNGPNYSFGILLNGIELDPIAAEPWPHTGRPGSFPDNVNWDWNLSLIHI